jgi:hypothetical protein
VTYTLPVASKLAFGTQPATAVYGDNIASFTVQIQSAGGALITTDNTTTVTLAIANNAGPGGTLSGTFTSVTAVNGVATFSNIKINKIGTGYTLSASSSPALTGATSTAFNITAKALTVTGLSGVNKVYDGNATATATGTAALNGVVSPDTVTVGGTPVYTFAQTTVGSGITITTTGYTLGGASSTNYSLTQPTLSANITAKSVTPVIVADDKIYNGNTTAILSSQSVTGVIMPDVVTLLVTAADFADKNVGTGKLVTATGLSLGGAGAGNYVLSATTATDTADITALAITVTAVTSTKPYDGNTSSTGVPTITSGTLLGGDSATWTQSFDTSSVGTGKTLTPTGTVTDGNSGNNYTVTFVANMTGVITPTSEIAIEQPMLTNLIDGSASVNFGTKNVAETSSLTFTVRNTGTGPLSLGALTIDGTHAGDYSITALPVGPVSAPGSTTFVVDFSPLQIGASTAVLHLVNDDSNENPFDITLTGTGTNIIGSVLEETTPMVTVSSGDFVATNLNIETDLGFIPTPGSTYTFIDIVNPINGIIGTFNDLPDGGVIAMNYNGVIYYFQADYTGGSGNDLTLTNFTPAAAPAWRWAAGPNKRNTGASFGALNVAAGTNNPGSRQGAMNWRGADGSLWLFGGYGYASSLLGQTPKGLHRRPIEV